MTTNSTRTDDMISSGKARAKRLKSLRKMTSLSRKAFSAKHLISQGTMQNWETARFGGLTEKGARNVLEALRKEGIHCAFEWLMYGIGTGPTLSDMLYNSNGRGERRTRREQPNPQALESELTKFKQLHRNAVHLEVQDDFMAPIFQPGEIVAGKRRIGDAISTVVGKYCIVDTNKGETLLRYVRPGSTAGSYNLWCINPDCSAAQPLMYDVSLVSAAPVIWTRRQSPQEL